MGANARRRRRRTRASTGETPLPVFDLDALREWIGDSDTWGVSTSMLPGDPPPCGTCGQPSTEVGYWEGVPFARCDRHDS